MLLSLAASLAMPPASPLLLAALGGLLAARGRRRAGVACALAGGLTLAVLSAPAVADALRSRLERLYPPVAVASLPAADAILVLGGGVEPAIPPRVLPDLGGAADRLWLAARLYRGGKAPVVLVAGGAPVTRDPQRPESDAMAWVLRALGVPRAAILRESTSRDTAENCRNAAEILAERAARRVLLVTSALHMPRALATCRSAGIRAWAAPTDHRVTERGTTVLDWVPAASGLASSESALREMLGYLVYRLRGDIAPPARRARPPSPDTPAL